MDIGLLHPGAMGAEVGAQAVAAGHRVLWLPAGRSGATAGRAERAGLEPTDDVTGCDVILSVCPPAAAAQVAAEIAGSSFAGLYVDANAISPGHAAAIAELFGGNAVDGGIVGPPPRKTGTTRLYLSGERASEIASIFDGTALAPTVLDGPIGRASALKLAFAAYNKISIALAAQAGALAAAHGVLDELKELGAAELPGTPLGQLDVLPGAAARAWRWAPEMAEIADAWSAVQLAPELAIGAEQLFDRWRAHKDDDGAPLGVLLDDLRKR
jgi:3-hydroxyisobutyrate dehydrogenase-like beta-hydroxyacid dehydrogenase